MSTDNLNNSVKPSKIEKVVYYFRFILNKLGKVYFCSHCYDTEYRFRRITGEKETCRECWTKYSEGCEICKGLGFIVIKREDFSGYYNLRSDCLSCAWKYPDFKMGENFMMDKEAQLKMIMRYGIDNGDGNNGM